MNGKEYGKLLAGVRRCVSRKYGFRQSSYINFKVEDGYFFCLFFGWDEARLTVKPMYADDLWWDIFDAPENKNEPLSLRGTGAFSLSGQVLATYEIAEAEDYDLLAGILGQVFQSAAAEISKFLTDHPDADSFFPDESKMDYDPDRLLYLMALLRNHRDDEALAIIKEARKNGHSCMFNSGLSSDSYTAIRRWCNRGNFWRKLDAAMDCPLNLITKAYAFAQMSMNQNPRRKSPVRWDYSPLQEGIVCASVLTCLPLLKIQLGGWLSLLLLLAVWLVLYDTGKLRLYYADFLKLSSEARRKWAIASWCTTAALWIYVIIMFLSL